MIKTFLLIFVLVSAASAGPISAGLKIGGPLTEALTTQPPYLDTSGILVIGPTVELNLPFGFGIELDALYRRYKYDVSPAFLSGPASAGSWEFPLLAKFRLTGGPLRPYVVGGPTFGRLYDLKQGLTTNPLELRHRSNVGLTLGAGLEVRAIVIRISPEIRWTGWANRYFDQNDPGRLQFNRNQATFLVGITF